MTRLQELTVVLYALSVLLYFIDFLHNNRRANRVAFWLLSFVWVSQTVFLFIYMLKIGRFPVLTLSEGLYFYAWVLITFSLVINRLLKVDFIVFFTNVIGFMIMVMHTFAPDQVSLRRSECTATCVRVAIYSYYSGHFILWCFFLVFCFFALVFITIQFVKTKKMGKTISENSRSIKVRTYVIRFKCHRCPI